MFFFDKNISLLIYFTNFLLIITDPLEWYYSAFQNYSTVTVYFVEFTATCADLHVRNLHHHITKFQGEPSSPQPSIDRLSVTFAEDSQRSDISSRCNLFNPNSLSSPITSEHLQFPPHAGKLSNFPAHYMKTVYRYQIKPFPRRRELRWRGLLGQCDRHHATKSLQLQVKEERKQEGQFAV